MPRRERYGRGQEECRDRCYGLFVEKGSEEIALGKFEEGWEVGWVIWGDDEISQFIHRWELLSLNGEGQRLLWYEPDW